MRKILFSIVLGMTASLGYGQTLNCSSAEITFVADFDAKTLNTSKNTEITIKGYSINTDGAGAVVLESGNLVTLIDDEGSLMGELFVDGKTYPALECSFN
ncbi:MAG: hypothetical protein AB8G05_19925 [Oligoflexales bacterium]